MVQRIMRRNPVPLNIMRKDITAANIELDREAGQK